jgi:hypothetical protein
VALRPLPPAVFTSLAPACPSPATIKGRGAPPGHHHTHPALICSLSSPQRPPHRAPPPPVVPHRRPAMSVPPPPPLVAGEAHRHPLPLCPQPRRGSTHGGAVPAILRRAASEEVSAVHRTVDSVHGIFCSKLNPRIPLFRPLCKKPLYFLSINPQSTNFHEGPWNLKNNSKKVPSLRKIHKNSTETSKFHIFQTTTPNLVIPSP